MRYFKSFFKHTWQPQQMDSGRYSGPRHCEAARRSDDTELGEMRSVTSSAGGPASAGVPCYEGACKSSARRPPIHRLDSPWHYLKTVFLVSIIISFVVWLIAYILLTQYGFI